MKNGRKSIVSALVLYELVRFLIATLSMMQPHKTNSAKLKTILDIKAVRIMGIATIFGFIKSLIPALEVPFENFTIVVTCICEELKPYW